MPNSRLGDAPFVAPNPDDIETDVLQTLHIYVPSPGDESPAPPFTNAPSSEGPQGSVITLGATMATSGPSAVKTNSYTGFGVRTHGHVFIDARGTGSEEADKLGSSRVTVQSIGQTLVQSVSQDVHILAKRAIVSASTGDHYVSSRGGLILSGGFSDPSPQQDTGPVPDDLEVGTPTRGLIAGYTNTMATVSKLWSTIDGCSGTFFAYKAVADLVTDLRHNDAPEDALGWVSAALALGGALVGVVGAGKSSHDAVSGPGVPADDKMAETERGDPAPGLGTGVNIFGAGGILAASPFGINMYAGTAMSLGSTNNIVWGVNSEFYGMLSTLVTSNREIALKSGGDVKIAAKGDIDLLSRAGDVGVLSRRIQLGYARELNEPIPLRTSADRDPKGGIAAVEAGALAATEEFQIIVGVPDRAAQDAAGALAAASVVGMAALAGFVAAEQFTPAREPPLTVRARTEISDLDHWMEDKGEEPEAVIETAEQSPRQRETEDIFLKAKKSIRLKSHERVDVGAAKKVRLRVGPMVIEIDSNDQHNANVNIGMVGADGALLPTGPSIRIDASNPEDPTIKLRVTGPTPANSPTALSPPDSEQSRSASHTDEEISMTMSGQSRNIVFRVGGNQFDLDSMGVRLPDNVRNAHFRIVND